MKTVLINDRKFRIIAKDEVEATQWADKQAAKFKLCNAKIKVSEDSDEPNDSNGKRANKRRSRK
jgi:hypothetical protein